MSVADGNVCTASCAQVSSNLHCLRFGVCQIAFLAVLTLLAGCQQALNRDAESAVIELSPASFDGEVIESEQPTLVEFWAPWCEPCMEMQPEIEQLARELEGRVKVARLKFDQASEIAETYDVTAPPYFILFRDGKVVKRRSGKQTRSALQEMILEAID